MDERPGWFCFKMTSLKKIVHLNTFLLCWETDCARIPSNLVIPAGFQPNPNPTPDMNADTLEAPTPVLTESATTRDRAADHTLYKPNSRGSGGAVRFGINPAKGAIFVDAAAQSGERQFDWERKITMKWNLADIGQVLATLEGRQPQTKLFHQSEKSNSAFELTLRDDPERPPYLLSLSRQETADKQQRKVAIPVSHGEAAVLAAALRGAVTRLLRW